MSNMKVSENFKELHADPFGQADKRIKTFEEYNTTRERVHSLLLRFQSCRNSDKHLIIHFLESYGIYIPENVKKRMLKELPSFETITRCRRKVQENFPALQASGVVENERKQKENNVWEWTVTT